MQKLMPVVLLFLFSLPTFGQKAEVLRGYQLTRFNGGSFKWVECCAYRHFSPVPWLNRQLQRRLQFWHALLHLHFRS